MSHKNLFRHRKIVIIKFLIYYVNVRSLKVPLYKEFSGFAQVFDCLLSSRNILNSHLFSLLYLFPSFLYIPSLMAKLRPPTFGLFVHTATMHKTTLSCCITNFVFNSPSIHTISFVVLFQERITKVVHFQDQIDRCRHSTGSLHLSGLSIFSIFSNCPS